MIAALRRIEGLRPDVWTDLNVAERLRTLQAAEDAIASVQGRPPASIFSYDAEPDDYGYYDGTTNRIGVGSHSLAHDAVYAVVDTLVHEGRHAYQEWTLDHPGAHDYSADVEAWRGNFADDNYVTPDVDYAEYLSQPVEADARRYARLIADNVYGEGDS